MKRAAKRVLIVAISSFLGAYLGVVIVDLIGNRYISGYGYEFQGMEYGFIGLMSGLLLGFYLSLLLTKEKKK